jgi:hypothetical protein
VKTPAFVRTGAALVVFTAIGAAPCIAQTRVTSLDELRRELATGDVVTVVPAAGQPVEGRLVRLGPDDLAIRPAKGSPERGLREVTVRFDAIQSLRRPRDSARDGAAIGAGVGAAFAGALFVYALAVDRNEFDEWAPIYAGFAAGQIGIGALIGWAVDASHSKPGIRFEASPGGHTRVSVHPILPRGPSTMLGTGRGIGLAVSVSR